MFADDKIVTLTRGAAKIAHVRETLGWGLAVIALAKALRSWSLFSVYDLVHHANFPIVSFVFYLLLGTSVVFLSLYKPWRGGRKSISPDQWVRIVVYSVLLIVNLLLWSVGLKYYGPPRTILASDYADLGVTYIFAAVLGRASLDANKIKGVVMLLVAYMLLFWVDPVLEDSFHASVFSGNQPLDSVLPHALLPVNAHSFDLGFVAVPEKFLGGIALFLAVILSSIRKSMARTLYPEVGGAKRLFSMGTAIGAAILSPFALYTHFFPPQDYQASVASLHGVVSLIAVVLFLVVIDYHVESFAAKHASYGLISKVSFVSAFVAVAALQEWYAQAPSSIVFLCFPLVLLGLHLFFSETPHDAANLPLYSGRMVAARSSPSNFSIMRISLKQILEDKNSRSLFGFLIINFMFMFLELMYGVWTNSLGLISDSFHMLFDCTALAIGLYASVIARWEPNKVFSYGYGRVQVLSGFMNGLFLIFIAFFVLFESVERFMEPPEINTDRLLLVSFGGLCVNMIGVMAFHGAHDHGGGGDDGGHSHGHSHGGHSSHGGGGGGSSSFNMDGVFLHVLADTLGSCGVIVSSLVVQTWGLHIADPICSFCIGCMIFLSVIPLLRNTAKVLMQSTPASFQPQLRDALQKLTSIDGVLGFSDAHFWLHHSGNLVGTLHLQVSSCVNEQVMLRKATQIFEKRGVKNLTVEIEVPSSTCCNQNHNHENSGNSKLLTNSGGGGGGSGGGGSGGGGGTSILPYATDAKAK